MSTLAQYLAVAGAGAAGAVARLLVGVLCGRLFGTTFPVGTLIINISGSLFLGWFIEWARGRAGVNPTFRLAVGVGFVGAYTTFSTFMHESDSLLRDGSDIKAIVNLFGSLVLGLLAVRAGFWLASR